MSIRPDRIQFSTQLPNYINIGTPIDNIVISGTVGIGATVNFSVAVSTSVNNTRCDIYGKNTTNGNKQLLSTSNYISNDVAPGGGIYIHVSTELAQLLLTQANGSVTVQISIFNGTGSPVTLTTQTIIVSVVEYQIPY